MSLISRQYNARHSFNLEVERNTPSEEYQQIFELIESALKQKVKVYICDPFKPGSLFQVIKINRDKQVMLLKQPESIAREFKRPVFELGISIQEYKKLLGDPFVFTDGGDFLNAKPVKIIEIEEVIKKEQVFVEKNAPDSISKKKLFKEMEKAKHDLKKRMPNFGHIIDDVLQDLTDRL